MFHRYNYFYLIKYSNIASIIYHRYHHVYDPGDYYLVISRAARNFQVTTSQNCCLKRVTCIIQKNFLNEAYDVKNHVTRR